MYIIKRPDDNLFLFDAAISRSGKLEKIVWREKVHAECFDSKGLAEFWANILDAEVVEE